MGWKKCSANFPSCHLKFTGTGKSRFFHCILFICDSDISDHHWLPCVSKSPLSTRYNSVCCNDKWKCLLILCQCLWNPFCRKWCHSLLYILQVFVNNTKFSHFWPLHARSRHNSGYGIDMLDTATCSCFCNFPTRFVHSSEILSFIQILWL